MEIIIKLSQFLLSLSLLIILHELGHFIPAKLFKTRVEKFYLFFDVKFSLFKKKIGETVYGIGWLPLGGYVKIAGMIDESMDKEQMAQPQQPWEFRSKPKVFGSPVLRQFFGRKPILPKKHQLSRYLFLLIFSKVLSILQYSCRHPPSLSPKF